MQIFFDESNTGHSNEIVIQNEMSKNSNGFYAR